LLVGVGVGILVAVTQTAAPPAQQSRAMPDATIVDAQVVPAPRR
jgi:hypothetical protein